MGRVGTAFRAFFRVLGDALFAERIRALLNDATLRPLDAGVAAPVGVRQDDDGGNSSSGIDRAGSPPAKTIPAPPSRSEALTLLAALQRDARLVDFLKEDVAGYSDAQIGSAVREIHRDAAALLERMFALRPVRPEADGATVSVPANYDAARLHLVGQVSSPPVSGALAHGGWEATKVELPVWQGTASAANVIVPAEVEIR